MPENRSMTLQRALQINTGNSNMVFPKFPFHIADTDAATARHQTVPRGIEPRSLSR